MKDNEDVVRYAEIVRQLDQLIERQECEMPVEVSGEDKKSRAHRAELAALRDTRAATFEKLEDAVSRQEASRRETELADRIGVAHQASSGHQQARHGAYAQELVQQQADATRKVQTEVRFGDQQPIAGNQSLIAGDPMIGVAVGVSLVSHHAAKLADALHFARDVDELRERLLRREQDANPSEKAEIERQ